MARGQGTAAEDVLYGELLRNEPASVDADDLDDLSAILPTLPEQLQDDLDNAALACLEAQADQAGTVTVERLQRQAGNLTEAEAEDALLLLEENRLVDRLDPDERERHVGGRTSYPNAYRMSDLGAQIYKIRWDQANDRSR